MSIEETAQLTKELNLLVGTTVFFHLLLPKRAQQNLHRDHEPHSDVWSVVKRLARGS